MLLLFCFIGNSSFPIKGGLQTIKNTLPLEKQQNERSNADSRIKEAAKEADTRTAIQFLKEGLSVEQIARCIPALSIDEVRKLQEELLQTV